ncbi:hypothetical protein L218DRAFT_1005516 [Marasmius fiardii PR-910]|nr:hypothetical protein L218DRAFT_1005516 [Marasmius fiardii PR-910]
MTTPVPIPANLESSFSTQSVIRVPMATLSCTFLMFGFYLCVVWLGLYIFIVKRSSSSPTLRRTNQIRIIQITSLFIVTTVAVSASVANTLRNTIVAFEALKKGDYERYDERNNEKGLNLALQ